MKKFDPAVRAQILYVAAVTLILSVFLQAVFLVIGYWDKLMAFFGSIGEKCKCNCGCSEFDDYDDELLYE